MTDSEFEALSFEELLEELERLTKQMAAGEIGIEEAAALYERAGAVHAAAVARLERVRARVEQLRPPTPPA